MALRFFDELLYDSKDKPVVDSSYTNNYTHIYGNTIHIYMNVVSHSGNNNRNTLRIIGRNGMS